MGGKGKRRHHPNPSTLSGKKQKQTNAKGKDEDGSAIVLARSKKGSAGTSCFPIPGLMNLGNTCFFNSVMQNLAQSHYLRQKMEDILTTPEISVVLPSPRESLPQLSLVVNAKPGKFAQEFHTFIKEMRCRPKQPLNPRVVFNNVCKNASRFSSYQQQDSQELLRCLLDALRNEEVHRFKRAILDTFNVKGRSNDKGSISDQEKRAIKAYGMQAMQSTTYVDEVFGGKIVSSVTCLECQKCYEVEENFLDLSLPVPSECPKSGFSSRSSVKGKKKPGRHSSEDAEGDDEGEGINHKSRNKEEPIRLSKHQLKQKRKEEKKRTKMKQPHRFTIGQFNKDTPLEDILNEPLVISHGILDTPTVMRSASETTFDNQDSCLADDEVTFHSTQHDSDSSALFMLPGEDGRQLDNLTIEAVTNGEKKLEPLNDLVEDVSVGVVMDGNQNISDSVVAMYEATCNADKQNNPQGKDISPKDTPLQSPQANTGSNSQVFSDNNSHQGEEGAWVPQFGPRSREVSLTNVTSSLQNIEDTPDTSNVPEQGKGSNGIVDHNDDTKPLSDEAVVDAVSQDCSSEADDTVVSKKKPIDRYSIESCLQQFTAPELLTGSDRFCCELCTHRQQETKSNGKINKEDDKDSLQNASPSIEGTKERDTELDNELSPVGVAGCDEVEGKEDHTLSVLVEREEGNPLESSSGSSSPSSVSCKEEDEDTEMIESTKESDDNVDIDTHSLSDEADEGAVFRDAKKMMLICQPPPILCLHLKRFIQQGRNFKNMRKNNCFISFPMLLDVAPYTNEDCKEASSVDGQILYSLYGVVVHGGGMHGGHYTAFVRVRNELKLKDLKNTVLGTQESPSLVTETKTTDAATTKTCTADTSTADKCTSPSEAVDKESETVSIKFPESSDKATTGCLVENGAVLRGSSSPVPEKGGAIGGGSLAHQKFDLSCIDDGVWYHISDSHVRKATEAEVLRSEAYLLFYELLPLSSTHSVDL